MKTISTKTNPVFKRVQLLPLLPSVPPPQVGSAAMGVSDFTPPPGDLRRKMTSLAVCAMGVSQGFNAPAIRLVN
jgi:hypothetical protein